MKVAVLGAAGGIGQALALLLKTQLPSGSELSLYDIAPVTPGTVPEFTGAPEQLWRIEQLTDGTYRIMPKKVPGTDEELVLVSVGDSTPSLGKFDMNSDNSKWNFRDH